MKTETKCDICGNHTECGLTADSKSGGPIWFCPVCAAARLLDWVDEESDAAKEGREMADKAINKMLEQKTQMQKEESTLPIPDKIYHLAVPNLASEAQHMIAKECLAIARLLLDKNRKYGNSVFNPARIFSKSDPIEQINIRIDDKLSRLLSGQADEDEDVDLDLIGYLIIRRVAQSIHRTNS